MFISIVVVGLVRCGVSSVVFYLIMMVGVLVREVVRVLSCLVL